MNRLLTYIIVFLLVTGCSLNKSYTSVQMTDKGAGTLYVRGVIGVKKSIDIELMVDTGSTYSVINETTRDLLQDKEIEFQRNITAILANNEETLVPIYKIAFLKISSCTLTDHEVAVFPGDTRMILGLKTLGKLSPFNFSTTPPVLSLSNC